MSLVIELTTQIVFISMITGVAKHSQKLYTKINFYYSVVMMD